MTEPRAASTESEPYNEHPLYRTAMKRLAEGDEAGAVEKLRRLTRLYPEEKAIEDQIVRIELRATLAPQQQVRQDRSQPTPILRTTMIILLSLTACIVLIAGFALAYDRFVRPLNEVDPAEELEALRQEGRQRLEAGDWASARTTFVTILTQVPGDPEAQAALEQIEQQEALAQLYVDALSAQKQGDWQTALATLNQIEAQSPGYRDVPQRIADLQQVEYLETIWQQAQELVQAGDLQAALGILIQIRTQNPDFRRADVEEQLYQIYVALAQGQLSQANGSLDALRQAIGYLDAALALRPADRALIEERRLARQFVAGFEAAAQGDWDNAVAHWEAVHSTRPDYQGGVLEEELRKAYPLAARQLIATANGAVPRLRRAIAYLEQALVWQPGDQSLVEDRHLASEYIAGAEALSENAWDRAIIHWGPIYALRPDYQGGRLEELLRLACANSSTPDATLCSSQ